MSFKESIHIKNVGPIRDLHIKDIRPLTVLIGASATGKSTLMKVLTLMRYIYKMENIRSYLLNSEIKRSPFRLGFKNLLKDGLGATFSKNSEIEYVATTYEGVAYTIKYKGGKLQNKFRIANEHLRFFKEAYVVEERGAMPSFLSRSARLNDLGFYFNQTFDDFQASLQDRDRLELNHLGFAVIKRRTKDGRIRYFVFSTSDKEDPGVELKYASSGIQTSAPVVSLIKYFTQDFSFDKAFRRSILSYLYDSDNLMSFRPTWELKELPRHVHLYIEEPELNLFPTAQCALLNLAVEEAFVNKKEDRELSLMIATHSPYIANYINVLLRKSRLGEIGLSEEDFDVYLLEDGEAHRLIGEDQYTGESVVDISPLTEAMKNISREYISLERRNECIHHRFE
jgi:hypothetical protein BACCOPRO_01415